MYFSILKVNATDLYEMLVNTASTCKFHLSSHHAYYRNDAHDANK